MQTAIEIAKFLFENGPEIIAAVSALLSAIIAVALFVPGDQPEATLQKVVDFLAKVSKKPVVKE